jgi:hypothetical protein
VDTVHAARLGSLPARPSVAAAVRG